MNGLIDLVVSILALAAIGVGVSAAVSWGWGLALVGALVFGLVILGRLHGSKE